MVIMNEETQKDRIRGALICGAIGDALGYPVEFIDSYAGIQRRYGDAGITRLDVRQWWKNEDSSTGKAWVSDDTQMTLFTACGILNAKEKGSAPIPSICEAYIEWYYTQLGKKSKRFNECWIGDIPELNQRRAPGNTCLTALSDIIAGKAPHNNSKGCGGVMRIAPIPLYGLGQRISDINTLDYLAADAAKLTHQHPLGFIPAAFTAHVIYRLASDKNPEKEIFKNYIREGLESVQRMFTNHTEEVEKFVSLVKKAILLSDISIDNVHAIENELGGGWIAEETVAIAIYCTLSYFDNFERAMIAAVNHAGDSDSTGAVTGNLLGAAIGYNAIPQFYKNDLELHDVILHVADDLYLGKTTLQ